MSGLLPLRIGALRFFGGKRWACWVYPEGVLSIFYDGSWTMGLPPTASYFAESAEFLGYGKDIYWHMVEHDLLHHMVAEELGLKRSGAVWAQAHNPDKNFGGVMPESGLREEKRLVALQRVLNGRRPDAESWGTEGALELEARLGYSVELLADRLRHELRSPEPMTQEWSNVCRTC